MQLVVKIPNSQAFLLDLEETRVITVDMLIQKLQEKTDLKMDDYVIKFQSVELMNGTLPLSEYGIENLSSISVEPRPTQTDEETVSTDEIPRTIIITNIRAANQTITESTLLEVFSKYGKISRLIIQSDGGETQHAVIIYTTSEAAIKSIQLNGQTLLDSKLTVVLANSLSANGNPVEQRQECSVQIGSMLASGYFMGKRGVASVKKLDEQHRISMKVKAGTEVAMLKAQEIDHQYGISGKLAVGLETAQKKASELDSKYHISNKAQAAAESASQTAKQLSSKAMENEKVASSVKKIGGIFNSILTFSTQSIDEAKHRVQEQEIAEAKEEEQSRASRISRASTASVESTENDQVPIPTIASQKVV